ncbi:lipid-A-disaccharide synthase [bacterium]|nr:lipid-A-disaccharide synthase [bacterium]
MKIAISAGDPSGDEHAAKIVAALRSRAPTAEFFGMGGTRLRESGVETIVDSETDASVMGFFDVVRSLGTLRNAYRRMVSTLEQHRPNVLLLVDYQEFNLLLAKAAKKLGIRTVFFIAPTVWAWRPGRVKRFIRHVDELACIFPFEPKCFEELGYDRATFVGHPFTDDLGAFSASPKRRETLRREFGIPLGAPVVALFPGSRKQELSLLFQQMRDGFVLAQKTLPELHGIIPLPSSIPDGHIEALLPSELRGSIHLVRDRSLDVLAASDCGIIKSGTSNLQAALTGIPFTMVYQGGWIMRLAAKYLIQTNSYSIVNIIREGTIREITEREQYTAEHLAAEIQRLITDHEYRQKIIQGLQEVSSYLEAHRPGEADSSSTADRIAEIVLSPGRV